MTLYIFIIAVLNLGLGFIAAVHLGRCYNRLAVSSPYSEAVSAQQQAVDEPVNATSEDDATLKDSDEEPNDAAAEESVDADSKGLSEKPPNESADGPTIDDSDDSAVDLDALFKEIEA